jgi:hypothetical protein
VLFFGIDVPGYASLMSVMLFLGGIQLLSLGIIGEYIGRMFVEVNSAPSTSSKGCTASTPSRMKSRSRKCPPPARRALARRPPRKPLMISRSRRLNDLPRGILAAGSFRFCRRGGHPRRSGHLHRPVSHLAGHLRAPGHDLAFAIAFWFSFFGHRYITFQKQGAASKFLLVALFSLAVRNLILSGLLFAGLSGLLPVVIATLTVTVLTYLLSRSGYLPDE